MENEFKNHYHICLVCGKEFDEDYRIDKKYRKLPARFCSRQCANKYSSSRLDQNKKKLIKCKVCHKTKEVNIHTSNNFICNDCRNLRKKEFYRYPENCILGRFERSQAFIRKSNNLKNLGFNFEGIFEEEFFKIRNLLYKVYYEDKRSFNEIEEMFNFHSINTPLSMLKLVGFEKRRGLKEAVINSYITGRSTLTSPDRNYKYAHGWIETKFGKVYYRSNYELALINILVEKNLEFSLNQFSINYISSKDNLLHKAYPDFKIDRLNLIIETKSAFNYNEQDIIDRYKEIKKLGYDFIILEVKGHYLYNGKRNYLKGSNKNFIVKNFKVLKEFIEINKKEEIHELLGIEN